MTQWNRCRYYKLWCSRNSVKITQLILIYWYSLLTQIHSHAYMPNVVQGTSISIHCNNCRLKMNKYPWYCLVQILLSYCICQYTLIRMHNLDIELGVIFGIYSGQRLSFRVRKHFKIYCPKDSKSSSLVGVMIIVNCSSSDPVKCVKFISYIRSFLCSLYAVHCPIKWISYWPLLQIRHTLSWRGTFSKLSSRKAYAEC